MVSTDPISDMFTRIRNASLVNQTEVEVPYSKIKDSLAKLLVVNGFLKSSRVQEGAGRKLLLIEVSTSDQPSTITEIKRLSSPGQRVYVQSTEIPKVKSGRGLVILSTSKGLMTGNKAIEQKLGGELICEVY